MDSEGRRGIMLKKFVGVDPDKCTGCRICELVCSFEKEGVYNPRKSRIRVVRLGTVVNVAITCRLCDEPACVRACPRDALTQDENGVIRVDNDKCDGCGWCVEACEFGAIMIHPELGKAYVCDLCDGDPQCVKWCPEEALELTTEEIVAQKARISTTRKLFEEFV
ncbi:MAG TPA: 4Fe-4S dicluster domain-containing protein [Candidatus Bathyarchaeota archaeon]|nr:4Fe-4S dicluster domain-containing protein [Candidatus Bathyarchaeota archaeon]